MTKPTKQKLFFAAAVAVAIYLLWFRKKSAAVSLETPHAVPLEPDPVPPTGTGASYYTAQGPSTFHDYTEGDIAGFSKQTEDWLATKTTDDGVPLLEALQKAKVAGEDTAPIVAQISAAVHELNQRMGGI